MEPRTSLLVPLLVLALAGCVQDTNEADTVTPPPEPDLLVVTRDGARLEAEGDQGWLLVFVSVEEQGGVGVDYLLEYDMPSGGLLVRPSVMSNWQTDRASLSGTNIDWIPPTPTDSIDGLYTTSAMTGHLVVGVASPGPWSIRLDLKTNATLGASTLWRGNDTRMEHAEGLTDATGGRVLRFQTEVEAEGWTHFHVQDDWVVKTGAHRTDIRFPNGFQYSMSGHQLPAGGSTGAHDFFGTLADMPGTFQADLERLGASTSLDAWFLHMSGGTPRPSFLDPGGYLEHYI